MFTSEVSINPIVLRNTIWKLIINLVVFRNKYNYWDIWDETLYKWWHRYALGLYRIFSYKMLSFYWWNFHMKFFHSVHHLFRPKFDNWQWFYLSISVKYCKGYLQKCTCLLSRPVFPTSRKQQLDNCWTDFHKNIYSALSTNPNFRQNQREIADT
jgi:hypothetical protein